MRIRAARPADLPALLEIYNDAVVHTTASWDLLPWTPVEHAEWYATKAGHGHPVLVADEGGEVVGYCDLAQATIGFQLGGQVYSEIIFFEDSVSLDAFKAGTFEFAAQASAVAASADASVNADYEHGVAVFTLSGKGLMYEASIGGQKFDYTPKR